MTTILLGLIKITTQGIKLQPIETQFMAYTMLDYQQSTNPNTPEMTALT